MQPTPSDNDQKAGYLEGHLLIATPLITESCFHRSVVYMCAHNAEGAMGIIINHTIENLSFREVFEQLDIKTTGLKKKTPVYFGGPVDAARGFVIHSDDYCQEETFVMENRIALTSNLKILRDIAEGAGPENSILALGYAGWSPGQIEAEVESNSWISIPATPELVFETDNQEKWEKAARQLGVDIYNLSGNVGHA